MSVRAELVQLGLEMEEEASIILFSGVQNVEFGGGQSRPPGKRKISILTSRPTFSHNAGGSRLCIYHRVCCVSSHEDWY